MKFTKNRLLSLLLVLAMMLALVPTVFALTPGTLQFDSALNSALTVGQVVQTIATCSAAADEEGHSITYTVADNSDKVSIVNGKLTANHVGSVTITAKCSCAEANAEATTKVLTINAKPISLPSGSTSVAATVKGNTDKETYTLEGEAKLALTNAFNAQIDSSLTAGEKAALAPLTWELDTTSSTNTGKTFDSES